MLLAWLVVPAAVLGLIVGSFINVVSHRVPRGESVVRPRSRCPECQTEISPRDNIPIVSWMVLRGRCRRCSVPISVRYPATELATAVVFGLAAVRFGPAPVLPGYLLLFAGLVAVTVTDLELRLVPKRIVWPVYAVGAVLLTAAALLDGEPVRIRDAALGSAAAFAVLFIIHLISPRGMGFGDVRLAALLGLFLGWLGPAHVGLGIFAGFVSGGLAGVIALSMGRSRRSALPFAPFLAFGTLAAVLAGQPILDWYLALGT